MIFTFKIKIIKTKQKCIIIGVVDELKQRNVKIQPNTRTTELLKIMIHSLILERQRTGRLVQSSGALSVDPPSARRTRSSGAMSAGSTRMSAIDVKHISRWTKSQLENELKNRGVWYRSGSKKSELVTLLVNSITSRKRKA